LCHGEKVLPASLVPELKGMERIEDDMNCGSICSLGETGSFQRGQGCLMENLRREKELSKI
jgi:hypothetical protein